MRVNGKAKQSTQSHSLLSQVSGCEIKYEIVGRRSGDIDSSYADASLAKRELQWSATKNLVDMCTRLKLSDFRCAFVHSSNFLVRFQVKTPGAGNRRTRTGWRAFERRVLRLSSKLEIHNYIYKFGSSAS